MVVGSRWLGHGDYVTPRGRRVGMRILARLVLPRCGHGPDGHDVRLPGRGAEEGSSCSRTSTRRTFRKSETLVLATQKRVASAGGRRAHEAENIGRHQSIAGAKSFYYMVRVITVLLVDSLGRKDRG